MMKWTLAVCTLFFFTLTPVAHAQFSPFTLTGLERELTLTLQPAHPEPNQTVQFSIQTYGLDLNRSMVVWYANDAEIARGVGLTSASVNAGNAGHETHILVVAQDEEGITASAEAFVRPVEVDILWEALSYIPPFYAGRALPGTGSPIRAHAFARFPKSDGTLVRDSDIIYTWYRNDAVAAKGRGRSTAVLQGPELFGAATIRVVAESSDRSFTGEATERLLSTDPFVSLYENHPLFGVLYHRALIGSTNTLETEQKITAVPYFAGTLAPSDPSLKYSWKVNGESVVPDPSEPQTIIITAEGYTGPADVTLDITSLSDFFLRATGQAQLVFGQRTASFFSGINPFGSGE